MTKEHNGQQGEDLQWLRKSRKPGPGLPLFDVYLDAMQHPSSGVVLDRLVLSAVDWVNVVALDRAGRCVMVRQYRFGTGYVTLETPGGMVDAGEDSLAAARRELLEETGYGEGNWDYLGAVEPNPALHDNLCHHWLVTEVEPVAEPAPGGGEAIEVVHLEPTAIIDAARQGIIRHALALSALQRVYPLWPVTFPEVASPTDPAWQGPEWARVKAP